MKTWEACGHLAAIRDHINDLRSSHERQMKLQTEDTPVKRLHAQEIERYNRWRFALELAAEALTK